MVHLQLLVALTAQRLWALNLHTDTKEDSVRTRDARPRPRLRARVCVCVCVCVCVPSQDRPWDVTPDKASLHTLQ